MRKRKHSKHYYLRGGVGKTFSEFKFENNNISGSCLSILTKIVVPFFSFDIQKLLFPPLKNDTHIDSHIVAARYAAQWWALCILAENYPTGWHK